MNEAIRTVVEQRRRQADLRAWLDEMTSDQGLIDEDRVRNCLDALS